MTTKTNLRGQQGLFGKWMAVVRVTRMKRVDKMVSIEFEVEPGGLGVRGLFTFFRGKLKSNKLSKLKNNYTNKCLQKLYTYFYTTYSIFSFFKPKEKCFF